MLDAEIHKTYEKLKLKESEIAWAKTHNMDTDQLHEGWVKLQERENVLLLTRLKFSSSQTHGKAFLII